jgi:hypothetical protein
MITAQLGRTINKQEVILIEKFLKTLDGELPKIMDEN